MLNHSPRIVTDGLVLYLDAANIKSYLGSGTIWTDLSSSKKNTTLYNTPSFDSNNLGSIVFNGTNNYGLNNSFTLGTDPIFTISMWFKRTATMSGVGIWGLGGDALNNGICGYVISANKISIDLWGCTTLNNGQDYPLNTWVNVVWVKFASTFATSTVTSYVNGINYSFNVVDRNNSSVVTLVPGYVLGRIGQTTNLYYSSGEIANFKIYNRVLTATEVLQNYNALKSRFGL